VKARHSRWRWYSRKTLLVFAALFLGSLVVASQEFFCSAPGYSLRETEAALPLAGR
jgi:hypothetical protein